MSMSLRLQLLLLLPYTTLFRSQVNEFSRAASGMAGALLGAAFVLRALGDMAEAGGSALSWASPLGWAAQTAPYVHDRWRSEEHTSELQSRGHLVCRLLLEQKIV